MIQLQNHIMRWWEPIWRYEATNLMLNTYDYKGWFAEKELDDSTLKGDEKEELDDVLFKPLL